MSAFNKSRTLSNESPHDHGGFSSIELLIVVGLTIFLAATAIPIYGNFYGSSQLNERVAEIVQTIRTARERSVARLNDQPHGVFFYIDPSGPDRFVLYQGVSFNPVGRDTSYDRTIALEDSLSLTTTLAGDEVNFSRGLGAPSAIGDITLTNAIGKSTVITINSLGMVSD
jgi:Tfp pilus assembly protein FimT